MVDDELNKVWKNSNKGDLIQFNKSILLMDLNSNLEKFEKSIKKRDLGEIIVACLLIPALTIGAYFITETLSKIAMAILVPWCFLVIYMLRSVKKYRVNDLSISLKDYLVKHKQYIVKERSLLENVFFWYLLPPVISITLFFLGLHLEGGIKIIFISVIISFYGVIYVLNKRSVKKEFDPLLEKIDIAIKNLES